MVALIRWTDLPAESPADDEHATAHERDDRAAKTAKRWAAATERAEADRIQVRPSRLPGRWLTVYRDAERGRVEHVVAQAAPGPVSADRLACDCPAARAGDPVCKHRAAVMAWLGYPTGYPTAELMARSAAARGASPPCPGCGAPAPYEDCDCAAAPADAEAPPAPKPAPRVAWADPRAARRRDALAEARAHLAYLVHYAALDPAARDSVERALLALNRAYNAS